MTCVTSHLTPTGVHLHRLRVLAAVVGAVWLLAATIGGAQTPSRSVDELLRDIRSGDRQKATGAFGYAVMLHPVPREYLPVLREAVRYDDVEIRCLAATALWALEPARQKAMLALLRAEFQAESGQGGIYAARSLARLGPKAKVLLPELLRQFRRSNQPYEWERFLFPTLARLGPEVADDLLPFLADSARGPYLQRVFLPLGPKVVPRLRPALAGDDSAVRERALQILKDFGPANRVLRRELAERLADPSAAVRVAALEVVAEMGQQAVTVDAAAKGPSLLPPLRKLVADANQPPNVRARAADALAAIGPPAVDALPELFVALDGRPLVRFRAALAIQRIKPGNREAKTIVLDLLQSEQTPVDQPWSIAFPGFAAPRRDPTAVYLTSMPWELKRAGFPTSNVLPILVKRWGKLTDKTERWSLAHTIMTEYGHSRAALPVLYRWCDARQPQFRRMAVAELCLHAEAVGEVLPVLADELRAEDLPPYGHMWSDLRQLGPRARPLVPQLVKRWTSADDERRVWLADVLLGIDGPHRQVVRDWMLKEFRARKSRSYWEIFQLVLRHAPDHPELLRDVAARLDSDERFAIYDWCQTLGRMGPAARPLAPKLREALKSKRVTLRVRAAAALWKVERRPDDVVPVLIEALAEEANGEVSGLWGVPTRAFALPAVQALAEMGSRAKSAIPALRRQLDYPDPALRSATRTALRAIQRQRVD